SPQALPLQVVAPAGGYRPLRARWPPFRAGPSRNRPPLAAVGCLLAGDLGRGLAVGGRPCIGADRGWPPLLLAAFTAKM
ncbi:hypothetical protein B296_00042524, partial [Ensete ventricosum]